MSCVHVLPAEFPFPPSSAVVHVKRFLISLWRELLVIFH